MPPNVTHNTLFKNGNGIIVSAKGPGRLHLLSITQQSGVGNIVGFTETKNHDTTRFLISFSHSYNRFVFYWDGSSEAVYGTSDSLVRLPVGRSWYDATEADRQTGRGTFSTVNVSREASAATRRVKETTVYIIPESA